MSSAAKADLIGWAQHSSEPIFHQARTKNTDGTGVSRCGTNLVATGPRESARSYERPCADCTRSRPAPARRRRKPAPATASTDLDALVFSAQHLRITPAGQLVIRITDTRWAVLDLTTGEVVDQLQLEQAKRYPTLRSQMPTVELIGGRDLADEYGISLTAVSQLQARHADFPRPNVRLGGRAGWYPERLPELLRWNRNRGGRGGGGRPTAEQQPE